ncbi:BolA family transcriptional regulator [Pleionea sp. CnH1-48]|uniref:BolA family protein n=1 Tax=Pleionea sp. CnH1-48 TaxID=2954494 RepID=UPI002097C1F2|nr:BolA family protein [Pleionea sp. CnH1-48]MCO7226366.1 BolA family transcriptional regulator [Pleionea sp. CnH1-48]
MNEQRMEQMQARLTQALSPSQLNIIDESHKHIGHAGAKSGKGHFVVQISSSAFEGKRPLQCHRLIYDALGDMMDTDIHALSIQIQ